MPSKPSGSAWWTVLGKAFPLPRSSHFVWGFNCVWSERKLPEIQQSGGWLGRICQHTQWLELHDSCEKKWNPSSADGRTFCKRYCTGIWLVDSSGIQFFFIFLENLSTYGWKQLLWKTDAKNSWECVLFSQEWTIQLKATHLSNRRYVYWLTAIGERTG